MTSSPALGAGISSRDSDERRVDYPTRRFEASWSVCESVQTNVVLALFSFESQNDGIRWQGDVVY